MLKHNTNKSVKTAKISATQALLEGACRGIAIAARVAAT